MRLKDVLQATGGDWEIGEDGISRITNGNIGLGYYSIFTDDLSSVEDYKPILNGKIFDHFMNREIAYESIGLWQLAMRRKMNEIMPFYNQMYLSTRIPIVPIRTTDLTTDNSMTDTQTANQTGSSNSNSAVAAHARSVNSDTPQTMLQGDEDYASGAVDSNSQNTTTGAATQDNNSTTTDNASGTTTIQGYQGAASDLLIRYRESFINTDMMVINDLEELFMGIWDNGDSFTDNPTNNTPYVNGYRLF